MYKNTSVDEIFFLIILLAPQVYLCDNNLNNEKKMISNWTKQASKKWNQLNERVTADHTKTIKLQIVLDVRTMFYVLNLISLFSFVLLSCVLCV